MFLEYSPYSTIIVSDWLRAKSSPVAEEEVKWGLGVGGGMDEVDISVASDETELLLDLWEAQRCLWDPADRSYKNRGTRSVALTAIAEAFGRGWTIGEY